MKTFILCSGATHLKGAFDKAGAETCYSFNNYDNKRFFMNSDIYSRLPVDKFEGKDVVVVQSATLSKSGNEWYTTQDRIFELMEFLSILRRPQEVLATGHKQYSYKDLEPPASIEVVYTCMPCAKQDHACLTGEVNSAKLALDLALGMAEKVHIIDPHPPLSIDWFGSLVNKGKIQTISIVKELLAQAQKEMPDAIILGPDEGSSARLGIESFSKSRISSVESTISGSFDVKGSDVIILDDMVLSGGTLRRTREKLKELGANNIGAALTHTMPVWGGEENLQKIRDSFGNNLFVSDTIYTETFEDIALSCVGELLRSVK